MDRLPIDLGRRALLSGRRALSPPLLPWAGPDAVWNACTRCGACLPACPEAILEAGDGGYPTVQFRQGGCSFCGRCAEVCPEPVFDRSGAPWHLAAAIGPSCLALRGVDCQSCADACDPRAIRFRPALRSAPQPALDAQACTGCGACLAVCPTGAITVQEPSHAAG